MRPRRRSLRIVTGPLRSLTIRARTAVAFGLLFALLSAGVLAFVALMTQRGVDSGLTTLVAPAPESVGGRALQCVRDACPEIAADVSGAASGPVLSLVSDQQWLWSGIGVGVAAVVAAAVGWVVSRRMLRPLDAITDAASRISASTLHERIALDGPDDEVRRVSDTIDDLFARLETAFASQRHFVAQASHELRTPLALQRAAMQIGLRNDASPSEVRAVREQLLDANRRNEQLIASLLALAEADRGLDTPRVLLDVPDIADDVLAGLRDAAATAWVDLRRGPWGGLATFRGDRTLTRQLLHNLVDNAIEYNVEGGTVRITGAGDWFAVENTGAPVSEDDLGTLVRPFSRPDPDAGTRGRRHNGLGLSIVDAIVRAHGWSLAIEHGTAGGIRVTVRDVSSM